MISAIIVTLVFIAVVILIFTNKISRAIASLGGAIIVYFTLIIEKPTDFTIFIDFLLGKSPNFDNIHALILIMGMLFIVQVCVSAGVFQFIAFKLIQMTKGKPINLLFIFCLLSVVLSALLSNILTVIILIPLTIVATRILNIDPSPYIICEAILVNVGGMVFTISSIPNILISTYANISLFEFFINVGFYSFILFGISMIFFRFYYHDRLVNTKKNLIELLLSFDVWNYVSNRKLFYKSLITFLIVLTCLIVVPAEIVSPDIVALTGAVTLVIISRLDGKEIIKKLDLELLLYLMGIFVITGAMNETGVISLLAGGISNLTGGSVIVTVIIILWVSAFLSSSIDNIPITQVLIPVVSSITTTYHFSEISTKSVYYSLAWGANLGDNLTPMGDNIIVMNLAEQNGRPIRFSAFFKLGFMATILQLIAVTIYFVLINDLTTGLFLIFLSIIMIMGIIFFRYLNKSFKKEEYLIFSNVLRKLSSPKYARKKKLIFQEFKRKFIQTNYSKNKKQIVRSVLRNTKRFLEEML